MSGIFRPMTPRHIWWDWPTHPLWSGQWGALNKLGKKPSRAQIFSKFLGKGLPRVRFMAWLRAEAWVIVFMRIKSLTPNRILFFPNWILLTLIGFWL